MTIVSHVPELVKKRRFRYQRKVNLRQVQRDTGFEYSTVARWMKSKVTQVDFPVLEAWCKYLDCNVGDLLEYKADGEREGAQ